MKFVEFTPVKDGGPNADGLMTDVATKIGT